MSAHRIPLPQINQTAAQTKTILLVEDEALIAMSEKLMLQKQGFSVLTAANGESAVETALRTPEIDLVLMDINLGSGMDGTEAAQQILAQRDLPILFLSSHTEREVVEKTEKITSYGYVVKHSGETVLLASIKMAFKLFDAHQKLKQQEAALRESESRLKEAQRIGKIGNWEWIISENKVLWSDEMYAIFGISQDIGDLSAEMTIQAFHPDDRAMIAEATRKTLEERQPQSIEARLLRPDGSIHYVLGQGVPVLDARGQLSKVRGIYQDITDHKQAEESLRESLQASADIVQSIPSGFFIYQFEAPDRLILLSANPEAERLTGIRTEQWKGREFNDIWSEARKHGITEHYLEVMQTGVTFETEDLYYSDERLSGTFRIRAFALPQNRLAVAFENITDRKQVEEALRKSEEKFRALFDNVPIGVALHEIIVDHDNHPIDFIWLDCNPAYETMTALKRQDIIGKRGLEVLPSLERKWIEFYGNVALTGEAAMIIDHSDYLDRYWEIRAYSPGAVQFAVAMNDVTDRKRAEEKLNIALKKYQILFDSFPMGISITDRHGKILETNREAERLLGISRAEHEQRTYNGPEWRIIRPDGSSMPTEEYASVRALREQRLIENVETGIVKAQNNVTWISVTAAPIPLENYGVAIAYGDITDHKRAEESLRRSEARFRSFMDNSPTIAWAKDDQGRHIYLSRTYENQFGVKFDDWRGKTDFELWPPEIAQLFWKNDRIVLASDQTIQVEEETRNPDGSRCTWWNFKFPFYDIDGRKCVGGIGINITDRKRAEKALRQSEQQLRELNAQKDKFFSILAHDLKNPLLGFLSFADLLEHHLGSMGSEERKGLIQHFRTSAETLFALLDNLLTWAHLQHEQVESHFDQFPIDQLAAHAVNLLTPNAEQKQIRLINTTRPVSVYASIEMVGTVVRNLLANAIKFTPFDGEVTITAAQTVHNVQVTVADTGIGIPPDQLNQLFRIDGKTQREGTNGEKGTGLGLILCKEFVEKQGGQIWVESEPGKGTRVMFTLPTQPRG